MSSLQSVKLYLFNIVLIKSLILIHLHIPELPDLEIFAANLEKLFKDKILERLEVQVAKKLNVSEKELRETLEGHQLTAVKREGKTIQCKIPCPGDIGIGNMQVHIGYGFVHKDGEWLCQIIHEVFFQELENDLPGLLDQDVLCIK